MDKTERREWRPIEADEPVVYVGDRPTRALTRTCETCKAEFHVLPQRVKKGGGKFCSRGCFGKSRQKRVSRECKRCGEAFTVSTWEAKRGGVYCSRECDFADRRGRRKKAKVKHRARYAPEHPIAPPSGTVAIARLNLYEKIGSGVHACHWCGREVRWRLGLTHDDTLVADHLNWDAEDDRQDNLVPSCITCNAQRRADRKGGRIRDDELWVPRGRGRTRAVQRTCETCKAGFLVPPVVVRKGGGRYCSPDCMHRRNSEDRR